MGATDQVVVAIAGNRPVPDWLPQFVEDAQSLVGSLLAGEADYPGRKELRRRLASAMRGARRMRDAFADPALLAVLQHGSSPAEIRALLTDVERIRDNMIPALRRAAPAIRPGAGRDRYEPNPNGLNSKEVCAACIVLAWRELHGEDPPHTADRVHKACEELWLMSGGKPSAGGTRATWRNHLRAVKPRSDRELALIRDLLVGAKTKSILSLPTIQPE